MEERFNYSTNDATRFVDELKDRVHDLYDENKRLKNIINKTTQYVQSLSSKGRGCDIYEDIKQDILKELKGVDKE